MRMIGARAPARLVLGAAAVLTGTYTAPAAPASPAPEAVSRAPVEIAVAPEAPLTEHVIVISIDGLRPDAIERFGARTLQRLMAEGSYTLAARTITPSRTLPSHTSMLTGETPDVHGITWNDNRMHERGVVAVPTIFARAREHGLQTAAFFSKGKFEHLNVPSTLDHVRVPAGNDKWKSAQTADLVERYLSAEAPNLMFVHLTDPDAAGHTFSWMSWFYGRAVRRADQAVERVLEAADRAFGEGEYAVIITADHGGHGWGHGSPGLRDMTIPWIAWGEGIRPGRVLASGISTTATAWTALRLLGVPSDAEGEVVQAALASGSPAGVTGER